MTEQLVADIWLRCVHWVRGVANILSAVEHAERKTCHIEGSLQLIVVASIRNRRML